MAELKDYSGEFVPNQKVENFSKECLVKLMNQWSAGYIRMDEIWVEVARKRLNMEEAMKWELEAWTLVAQRTLPRIAKVLGIEVKTVLDVLKVWQTCPDGTGTRVYNCSYEIKNPNHVIWHIDRCGSLEFFERNNQNTRIVALCQVLETPVLKAYLKALLPNAQINPVKLPTGIRKNPSAPGPACSWEIRLDA